MSKYRELSTDARDEINVIINRRWGQLYELEKEWAESALKYLFLTNCGGAIATLSFLGSNRGLNTIGTKAALILFVVGIILAGISTAKTFHYMSWLFKEYRNGVESFYKDQTTWSQLSVADQNRAVPSWIDFAIPYSSFGCFILGCLVGGLALFS